MLFFGTRRDLIQLRARCRVEHVSAVTSGAAETNINIVYINRMNGYLDTTEFKSYDFLFSGNIFWNIFSAGVWAPRKGCDARFKKGSATFQKHKQRKQSWRVKTSETSKIHEKEAKWSIFKSGVRWIRLRGQHVKSASLRWTPTNPENQVIRTQIINPFQS